MPPPAANDPVTLSEPAAFGAVLILPAERRLLVRGQPAALGARAFDLLLALAARRERVVGKDELMDLVWPGVVVEENNLAAQISALRKLLGAQAITTVAGRGYRFTLAPAALPPVLPSEVSTAVPSGVAPASPSGDPGAALPASTMLPAPGVGARVLLAEDNKVNRLLLCRTLELQGWQVSTADNGRQALDLLRQQPFALLLLDLEMPELDGFALLQLRRDDAALRDTPVIVTSSLDGVGPVARCIELGADDYLHKPVNATLLRTRVGACLERRQLRHERDVLRRQLDQARAAPAAATAGSGCPPAASDAPTGRLHHGAVLVLRLVGVDALLQAHAAEDTLELLNNWHTLMHEALRTHAGQLLQATADSLTVWFGPAQDAAPSARAKDAEPDDRAERAERAMQASLDMAEMLHLFNTERRALGRLPLQQGAGLACGELLLGWTGTPEHPVRACLGAVAQRAWALAATALPPGCSLLLDAAAQPALAHRPQVQRLAPAPGHGVEGHSAESKDGDAQPPVYGVMSAPAAAAERR